MNNTDKEYFRLLNEVLTNGRRKKNRTGIDTIGVFGAQAKFDVRPDAFPILTTKKVHFPAILHELLWFIKGDTNIKYLVDNNVRIWNEWAYKRYVDWYNKLRIDSLDFTTPAEQWVNSILPTQYTQDEFIQKIKEDADFAKRWGQLGMGTYGGMWRAFPYCQADENNECEVPFWEGYVDQLKKVVDKLKTNPDDRRMIVSAWHPYWVDYCALPPCHVMFHFNTEEMTLEERWTYAVQIGKHSGVTWEGWDYLKEHLDQMNIPTRKLNCLLYQRSCDLFLGVPFNITSYCLLTAMIAHCVNMAPGVFTHTYGDLHIYDNHMEQVKTQLNREPLKLPKLWINPEKRDLFSLVYDDIRLQDYNSHATIKAEVAV